MSGPRSAGSVEPPRKFEKQNWLQMNQVFFCIRCSQPDPENSQLVRPRRGLAIYAF